MGGGKGSSRPSGPDGGDLIEITERNIEANRNLFTEYMNFAKETFDRQDERAREFYETSVEEAEKTSEFADLQRQRYVEQAIPLEDQYIERVMSYDTPERREQRASRAAADAMTASQRALEASKVELERLGVDPSVTRGKALDRALRTSTALTAAGAATRARERSEITGIQLQGEGTNVGKGLPASSGQALSLGLDAQSAGVNATGQAAQLGLQGYQQGAQILGQGQDIASSGYNVANNIYANDLRGWQIANEYSPMNIAAGIAGTAFGAGLNPAAAAFGEGGEVTSEMSPSRGAIPDDVPARLTAGEVVLSPDTVRYHGIKTLKKLDKEAKEAMGGAI